MLTYNFTNIGSDSMYEYLYKCIKNDILQGILQAGEKLPSKRSFAKNLGISVITVENAYEQLIAEGYIYSMPKRGFYVTDFKGVLETKQREEVQEIIPMTSGENSYLADFTSNQTEADQFPFTIWAKMVREVLSDSRIQLMTNPPCGGIMSSCFKHDFEPYIELMFQRMADYTEPICQLIDSSLSQMLTLIHLGLNFMLPKIIPRLSML